MAAALAVAAHASPELHSFSFERLTQSIGVLLERAVKAGEIRTDVSPEDLFRALVGMCYLHDQPGWQSTVVRLMDVFVDGLRVQPEAPRKAGPRRRTTAKRPAARTKKKR